jgi:hypothetical protein
MLHSGNIYAMALAVKNLSSTNPVLEIGSFCGLSTNVIAYLLTLQGKENTIVSCDRWIFEGAQGGQVGKSSLSFEAYCEFVKSSFINNVKFFSPQNLPFAIETFSDDFFELWEKGETVQDVLGREIRLGGRISFCYIDGNHAYDYVRRDFHHTDKILDLGGYILFDDTADFDPYGLRCLMKEIQRNRRYKLVIKNPNYLFKKIAD